MDLIFLCFKTLLNFATKWLFLPKTKKSLKVSNMDVKKNKSRKQNFYRCDRDTTVTDIRIGLPAVVFLRTSAVCK